MKRDSIEQDFIVKDFRELKVWKKAISLSEKIYKLTKGFPKYEEYGIRSQVERASVSISSNIAEGNSFSSLFPQRLLYHYNIALGSAFETRSQIELILRVGYINKESFQDLDDEVCEIIKMLSALIKRVKNKSA